MSSKRNIIILVIALIIVMVGGIIAAVAIGSVNGQADISETLSLAQRYLDEENYEQAVIEFDRIIEIDPMNVDAYLGKAEALIALGDADEAIEVLEDAYELTGDEDILAMLEELTKPEETVQTTTSLITFTDFIPEFHETEEPTEPVHPTADVHYEPHDIAEMLCSHITNGTEVNTEMLCDVQYIMICDYELRIQCTHETYQGSAFDMPDDFFNTFKDISFLEHCPNITQLYLSDCWIHDITVISGLKHLKELKISMEEHITDLSPLAALTDLEYLYISGYFNDISPIMGLTKMKKLDLNSDELSDISPVGNLTALEILWISDLEKLTDISPLSSLVNLKELYLYHSRNITDISPLAPLIELEVLTLSATSVTDISPLAGMKKLQDLELNALEITNPTVISELTEIRELEIAVCGLTDISFLAPLTKMERLNLNRNPISDASVVYNMKNLTYLQIEETNIENIDQLQAALPECYIVQ